MQKKVYEGMFLLSVKDLPSPDKGAETVKAILLKHGAQVERMKVWDERRLAYQIGPHKRGLYVLVYFRAAPESIVPIKRDCVLSERVIRVLILALTEKVFDEVLEKWDQTEQQVTSEPLSDSGAAEVVSAKPETEVDVGQSQ